MTKPHLFLSYSWSTPEHEEWVEELAKELTESGIYVVFDKWDLREGHDSIAFMEKMVNDANIKKVALICDRVYAEKANRRTGGVGTEAQIISPEIYSKQDQAKFVAVIAERDEHGNPFLPTYYKSRIFIDLSDAERRSDSFEKLVRWVFDKPLHVRPESGAPPSYILETSGPSLGTSVQAKRVLDGIRSDKAYARGALVEYFETFKNHMERFRVNSEDRDAEYEWVIKSVTAFVPYRDQVFEIVTAIVQYGTIKDYSALLHRFLESLLPYYSRPENVNSWNETDFDNFKFLIHELFLGIVAILLKADAIEVTTYLLAQKYYLPQNVREGRPNTGSYLQFMCELPSLQVRNEKSKPRWLSPHGELLKTRAEKSTVSFQSLMQADFLLFIRADLARGDQWQPLWWPVTLAYIGWQAGALEVFARAASKENLPRVLRVLGVPDLPTLKSKLQKYSDRQCLPRWEHHSFSPETLLGIEQMGTTD